MYTRLKRLLESVDKCRNSLYEIPNTIVAGGLVDMQLDYKVDKEELYIEKYKLRPNEFYICLRQEDKIIKFNITEFHVSVEYFKNFTPQEVYNLLVDILNKLENEINIIFDKMANEEKEISEFSKELTELF